MELKKKMPITHALIWIIVSTFLVTGGSYSILKKVKGRTPVPFEKVYSISKIIQTGPHRDHLTTAALAEVLCLSIDKPTLFKNFSTKEAESKLVKLPMIQSAKVHLVKQDILYIDYVMRTPIAILYDYENTALDEEGYAFPFYPYYSPKSLPEIYLGEERDELLYEKPIETKSLALAFRVLRSLKKIALHQNFYIKRIDVSKAFEKSLGKKEIILQIYNKNHTLYLSPKSSFLYTLRLDPLNYAKNLGNYLMLHKELIALEKRYDYRIKEDERVIDLRIDNTAYIEEIERH